MVVCRQNILPKVLSNQYILRCSWYVVLQIELEGKDELMCTTTTSGRYLARDLHVHVCAVPTVQSLPLFGGFCWQPHWSGN